jgi:hypothetical protein
LKSIKNICVGAVGVRGYHHFWKNVIKIAHKIAQNTHQKKRFVNLVLQSFEKQICVPCESGKREENRKYQVVMHKI